MATKTSASAANADDKGRDVPERVSDHLDYCRTECVRYCRYGNLFATGTVRGQVAIWDSDTRSLATVLGEKAATAGDAGTVVDVGFPFPRTGVTVLAAHSTGHVRLWNTLQRSVMSQVVVDQELAGAVPHPKRSDIAVVVPKTGAPVVMQLKMGSYKCILGDLKAVANSEQRIDEVTEDMKWTVEDVYKRMPRIKRPPKLLAECDALSYVHRLDGESDRRYFVCFTRDGKYLLRASDVGALELYELSTSKEGKDKGDELDIRKVSSGVLGGSVQVKDIIMTSRGDRLLVHCSDKVLRLYALFDILQCGMKGAQVDTVLTFKDVVGQSTWKCATISADGSLLVAAVQGESKNIIMYNTADGQIERQLPSQGELMKFMAWHPRRALLITVGMSGSLYVWEKNYSENWSAFAPDFKELEANEEYIEKEDEFDLPDEEDKRRKDAEREEEEKAQFVDVLSLEDPITLPGAETDDDEAPLFFIPAVPGDDLNSPLGNSTAKKAEAERERERELARERERERTVRKHRNHHNANGTSKRKRAKGSDRKKRRDRERDREARTRRKSDESASSTPTRTQHEGAQAPTAEPEHRTPLENGNTSRGDDGNASRPHN